MLTKRAKRTFYETVIFLGGGFGSSPLMDIRIMAEHNAGTAGQSGKNWQQRR